MAAHLSLNRCRVKNVWRKKEQHLQVKCNMSILVNYVYVLRVERFSQCTLIVNTPINESLNTCNCCNNLLPFLPSLSHLMCDTVTASWCVRAHLFIARIGGEWHETKTKTEKCSLMEKMHETRKDDGERISKKRWKKVSKKEGKRKEWHRWKRKKKSKELHFGHRSLEWFEWQDGYTESIYEHLSFICNGCLSHSRCVSHSLVQVDRFD